MKKRETICRLRRIIRWYAKERSQLIDDQSEQDTMLIQMQHDLSDMHVQVKATDALMLEERGRADRAERALAARDQQVNDLYRQLSERLQHSAACVDHMLRASRERDTFRDQALALEEQLGRQVTDADPNRAYHAEIERDAPLSDVAARDDRIRVLERLLRAWLGAIVLPFAAREQLRRETRAALEEEVADGDVTPI